MHEASQPIIVTSGERSSRDYSQTADNCFNVAQFRLEAQGWLWPSSSRLFLGLIRRWGISPPKAATAQSADVGREVGVNDRFVLLAILGPDPLWTVSR